MGLTLVSFTSPTLRPRAGWDCMKVTIRDCAAVRLAWVTCSAGRGGWAMSQLSGYDGRKMDDTGARRWSTIFLVRLLESTRALPCTFLPVHRASRTLQGWKQ